jgi:hypothetical protein
MSDTSICFHLKKNNTRIVNNLGILMYAFTCNGKFIRLLRCPTPSVYGTLSDTISYSHTFVSIVTECTYTLLYNWCFFLQPVLQAYDLLCFMATRTSFATVYRSVLSVPLITECLPAKEPPPTRDPERLRQEPVEGRPGSEMRRKTRPPRDLCSQR